MYSKKAETKFTIQFSRTDPAHLRVVNILNSLERCFKAQYIVDAVLHYESNVGVPDTRRSSLVDEKHIEAVVERILRDKSNIISVKTSSSVPIGQVNISSPMPDTEISFNDAVENLGDDGVNIIAGALEMFRKK